jgi:GNAT superfamily N-acetyltransferase
MQITQATVHDAEMLAAIVREGFRDVAERFDLTAENCPKHPSNCTAEWVSSDFDRGVTYFLLWKDRTPCGCVALEIATAEVAYLERLAVLPRYRGRGFGAALVQHAVVLAQELGTRKISVGLIAQQGELRAWYRRLGFVEDRVKCFPHLPFRVAFLVRTR